MYVEERQTRIAACIGTPSSTVGCNEIISTPYVRRLTTVSHRGTLDEPLPQIDRLHPTVLDKFCLLASGDVSCIGREPHSYDYCGTDFH